MTPSPRSPFPPLPPPHTGGETPATRAVLLRHTPALPLDEPGGSWWGPAHLDWLIELPHRSDEHRLRAFRVPAASAGPLGTTPFACRPLPDHRAFYLDHEGDLSAGRGRVERLAAGTAIVLHDAPERFELLCTLGPLPRRWLLTPEPAAADAPAPWQARVVEDATIR